MKYYIIHTYSNKYQHIGLRDCFLFFFTFNISKIGLKMSRDTLTRSCLMILGVFEILIRVYDSMFQLVVDIRIGLGYIF